MLGNLVYESEGKVVAMRCLPNGKIEQTGKMKGRFLGEEFSYKYTVEGETKLDGTEHIKIRGFSTMKDGTTLLFSGIANGIRRQDSSMVFRGAACYDCPPGKYAMFNGIAVALEGEVDPGGFIHSKGWEWK